MKKALICLLCALPLLIGCKEKQQAAVPEEPLVPTGREREILRVYRLEADTEVGQRKLRRLRERQAKLDAARQRMEAWAAESEERLAEEQRRRTAAE